MRRFWNARAREDAFYFVDNTGCYGAPDEQRFWASGDRTLKEFDEHIGARVSGDDVVLDVGCGIGRLTRALAARAREVIALDVSTDMLGRAKQLNAHLDNVTWLLGDGVSLEPVADASVDAILSFVVFQHIPDPAITLGYVRDMGRVLRPGGWSAFQVSDNPGVHLRASQRGGLRHSLAALAGRAPRGQRDPAWRGSAIDVERLAATADEAGMDVERVDGKGTQFCVVKLRRR
jgi:SAM-dependent methyltransferase